MMTEEIRKKAEELGKLLKDSDEVKAANAAKAVYDNDEAVQQAIFEYNTQNAVLAKEYQKDEKDEVFMETVKKRIGERALRIVQAKDRHLGLARRPRTRRRIRLAPTSEDSSAAFRSHVSSADGRPLRFQACATQTRTPPECRLGTNRSN